MSDEQETPAPTDDQGFRVIFTASGVVTAAPLEGENS
jgi:hypothetical protein